MIYDKDIPDTNNRITFLKKYFHFDEAVKNVKPRQSGFFSHEVDLSSINIDKIFETHGWYGWADLFNDDHLDNYDLWKKSEIYGGLAISYNPEYYYNIPVHAQSLGQPRPNLTSIQSKLTGKLYDELMVHALDKKFFSLVMIGDLKKIYEFIDQTPLSNEIKVGLKSVMAQADLSTFNIKKNIYSDSYGFRYLTPAGQKIVHGLPDIHRSIVRSRCATIKGSNWDKVNNSEFWWHKDDTVFLELRLNFSLVSSPDYVLQVKDSENTVIDYEYRPNHVFVWDTDLIHRQHCLRKNEVNRTGFVVGVSPWFDFDPIKESWSTNKFFGVKHPYDMLLDGDILNLDNNWQCSTLN